MSRWQQNNTKRKENEDVPQIVKKVVIIKFKRFERNVKLTYMTAVAQKAEGADLEY